MAITERCLAFVLDRTPYKDFDRIYTLYTKERGLLRARARGAAKPLAKVRPHAEGFGPIDVMLVHGRQGFILASAEMLEPWRMKIPETYLGAMAVRRTIARHLREQSPDPIVYGLLADFLKDFVSYDNEAQKVGLIEARSAHFFWKLLESMGYNGSLDKCTACGRTLRHEAKFAPITGGFYCAACAPNIGVVVSKTLRRFLKNSFQPGDEIAELAPFYPALAEHFEHRLDCAFPHFTF
jgi:DNA repair protein RecO (recombination protein O)